MVMVRGYIDRIESDKMVIIAESLGLEFVVDIDSRFKAGDWVTFTIDDNKDIFNIQPDNKTREERRNRIRQLKKMVKRRQ